MIILIVRLAWKSLVVADCVVADAAAVAVETVSATEFLAYREIDREFFKYYDLSLLKGRYSFNDLKDLGQNSLLNGTGIFAKNREI